MVLKLQLVRDGEIVFEMPLSPTDWPRERFDNELGAIEEHFQGLSRIFSAFSSGTRLRMMSRRQIPMFRVWTKNIHDDEPRLETSARNIRRNTRVLRR
jgi:hypothetical protein